MRVSYEGEALKSRSRVFWQMRLWDESDTPGDWSEGASFELGLLTGRQNGSPGTTG